MAIYSGFTHWKWWFPIVMLIYRRVCCLHHQYYERRTSRKTATSPWGSDSANVQLGASRSLLDAVQMSLGARGDVFWGRQGWIKLEITMVITPVSWDITPISVYIYICTFTCIINYTYINYKCICTPKCRPDAYGCMPSLHEISCLVVWNMNGLWLSIILGMSSSQLTLTPSFFQRRSEKPPTRLLLTIINHIITI